MAAIAAGDDAPALAAQPTEFLVCLIEFEAPLGFLAVAN